MSQESILSASEMIHRLSRRALQAIEPYSVTAREEESETIFLNANENPFPREYRLTEAFFNRYPEPQPQQLIENYAQFLGVAPENLLVSLGGDESIELLIKAFCEPQEDYLLYCPPTFGMYQITCDVMGVETKRVPLREDFSLDIEGIKELVDEVKVIFLCSPNNPTGNTLSREEVVEVLEAAKGRAIVVLDEAYIEFSPEESLTDLIHDYPHLALIRTLSKAFGLAGIRCGFTIASAPIIEVLKKVIAPYPLPLPVIAIATESVTPEGIAHMREAVAKIIAERTRLEASFKSLPIVKKVHEGRGNWLLVEFKDANGLFKYLLSNNIHVRSQAKVEGLEDALRISIGTPSENDRLLEAITQFIALSE